jgi:hypothetical protein
MLCSFIFSVACRKDTFLALIRVLTATMEPHTTAIAPRRNAHQTMFVLLVTKSQPIIHINLQLNLLI